MTIDDACPTSSAEVYYAQNACMHMHVMKMAAGTGADPETRGGGGVME